MVIPVISHFSGTEVDAFVTKGHDRERHGLADVLLGLGELDLKKHYRELGYSSLFDYLTRKFGHSEPAAQIRICAARCLVQNPELYDEIKSGRRNLCNLHQVSRVITPDNKAELLPESLGLSRRAVEKLVVTKYGAVSRPRKEKVTYRKVVSDAGPLPLFSNGEAAAQKVEIEQRVSFSMNEGFQAVVEELKVIFGINSTEAMLEKGARELLKRERAKGTRKLASKSADKKEAPVKRSRYIARSVRRAVVERDGRQCTYVSPEGVRCAERARLQPHHIQNYSLGGSNEAQNLRLLCRCHNRLEAEKDFGAGYMLSKIHVNRELRASRKLLTPGVSKG